MVLASKWCFLLSFLCDDAVYLSFSKSSLHSCFVDTLQERKKQKAAAGYGKRFTNPTVRGIMAGILLAPGPVTLHKSVQGLSRIFNVAVTKTKYVSAANKLQAANFGVLTSVGGKQHIFVKRPPAEAQNLLMMKENSDLATIEEYEHRYNGQSSAAITQKIKDSLVQQGLVPPGTFHVDARPPQSSEGQAIGQSAVVLQPVRHQSASPQPVSPHPGGQQLTSPHPVSPHPGGHHPPSPHLVGHHPTSPHPGGHHPTSPHPVGHHPTSPHPGGHHPTSSHPVGHPTSPHPGGHHPTSPHPVSHPTSPHPGGHHPTSPHPVVHPLAGQHHAGQPIPGHSPGYRQPQYVKEELPSPEQLQAYPDQLQAYMQSL